MTQIAGKRVLVTGSAQGIGLEMAIDFARAGAEIILTDVNEQALTQAREKVAAVGICAMTCKMDVTDRDQIQAAKVAIHQACGPIDVLVNNAGIVFGGAFLDVPLEKHELTYRINTLGLVAVTHCFLPDLIASDQGHLVNIASASGFLGLPYGACYASSKWSVIGFGESIRLELKQLKHRHVHVTTVCPSYISTGLFDGVKAPLLTPILKPAAFAKKVTKSIQKNHAFLRTPFMVKTIPLLHGLFPRRLVDWIQAKFGVTASMSFWQGRSKP